MLCQGFFAFFLLYFFRQMLYYYYGIIMLFKQSKEKLDMFSFDEMKNYLNSKKSQSAKEHNDYIENYQFFIVKDYVNYSLFIVDRQTANYLFGGKVEKKKTFIKREDDDESDAVRSDCALNLINLTYGNKLFLNQDIFTFKTQHMWQDNGNLKNLIKEVEIEKTLNIETKWRDKTEKEQKEGRTIRLVGCYKTQNSAENELQKMFQDNRLKNYKCFNPKDVVQVDAHIFNKY